jgi:hypothetical protein
MNFFRLLLLVKVNCSSNHEIMSSQSIEELQWKQQKTVILGNLQWDSNPQMW